MHILLSLAHSSSNLRTKNKASVDPFPGMKPNCASSKSIKACILLSKTLSIIFMPCSSNFTPLYEPQFITSPFPLKIGTTTLVFHSSGIPFPSKLVGKGVASLPLQFCHLQQSSPLLFQRAPQPFPVSSSGSLLSLR